MPPPSLGVGELGGSDGITQKQHGHKLRKLEKELQFYLLGRSETRFQDAENCSKLNRNHRCVI